MVLKETASSVSNIPDSVGVNFTNFEKKPCFIKILRDEKVERNSLPPAKIILFQHLGTFFSF